MLQQPTKPPPRQATRATTRPEHITRIQAIVVGEVGFYRLRVLRVERAEAGDSGALMP